MKKLLIAAVICFSFFVLSLSACKYDSDLKNTITEERSDIFCGTSENIALSCAYGYTGNPEKVYALTFKLDVDPTTEISYSVTVNLDKTYTEKFSFNPVSHALTAKVFAKLDDIKSFDAIISFGSSKISVSLFSLKPENTLSVSEALTILKKTQPSLINSYINDRGEFDATLCVRLTVKSEHPYYYVAFTRPSGDKKALLLDGFTAEVLAVRDIF